MDEFYAKVKDEVVNWKFHEPTGSASNYWILKELAESIGVLIMLLGKDEDVVDEFLAMFRLQHPDQEMRDLIIKFRLKCS